MHAIKNISAIHLIVGGLTLVLTALIVLFLGAVVHCVASDIAEPDCRNRSRSGTAVAFDRQKFTSSGVLFQTSYVEEGWAGDLTALCVDRNGDPTECRCADQEGKSVPCLDPFDPQRPELKWGANGLAADIDVQSYAAGGDGWWRQRAVLTMHGDSKSGIPFHYDLLSNGQRNALSNDPDLVAYIRGDRTLEGSRFRQRSSYYGDFINFKPTTYSSLVIAGAND